MKALKKPLSMLLALLMCFGVFSGMGITAFAAGEEMTTYLVDLPRSADPQKTGWDHPALNLMGGWTVDESLSLIHILYRWWTSRTGATRTRRP